MEKSEILEGESKVHCEPLSVSLSKKVEKRRGIFNMSLDSIASTDDANSGSIKTQHEEGAFVEITMDVQSDSTDSGQDPKLNSLSASIDKKTPFDSSMLRNASVHVRQVSQEIMRLASLSKRYSKRIDVTKSRAADALKGLRFINKTDRCVVWADVEKQFDVLTVTTGGSLPRSLFAKCIGMKEESEEFGEQLFDALARRRGIVGDTIDKTQLKDFWDQINDQNFDCRLKTFFDMVDKNADGRITREEVKEIIYLSATTNHLANIKARSDEYAALIMEELDPNGCGYIMIENLETLLLYGPSHSVRDSRYLSKMLSQKLKPTYEPNPIIRWGRRVKYFLLDNWRRFWVLALWIGAMAGLFAYKYIQYKHKAAYVVMGHCVCFAKGAAETLKLNMALILLPVCRNTITWLRNKTNLSAVVPFDDNINFHMVIALAIAIGVGFHAIFHLACDFPRLLLASSGKYKLMEPFFGPQPSSYWVYIKSVEGVTGIIIIVLMAIAFSLATQRLRRSKIKLSKPFDHLTGFNAFWYCHHLFIIVYALLIVHGIYLYLTKEWYKKTTWMYLAVPVIIYMSERLIRALRSSVENVKVLKVVSYPGKVLGLYMSKPHAFRYRSGQYMFVKCSAVSPFEWHPLSITSAPCDDFVSVHIRIVGDWTRHLNDKFSKALRPTGNGENGRPTDEGSHGDYSTVHLPKIEIDGPYGAPAQDYRSHEVVMLIGLGIGATPMISILKDIAKNTAAMDEEENGFDSEHGHGQESTHHRKARNVHVIRKAYFYWSTREQGTFDWFKDVMNEVAEIDKRGVIEFHNYCTSVYEEGDARSALIAMLQSLNHAKNGVDVVSGTRVKSHFGKPNWHDVYKHIALHHPNASVGVFYCGPPPVAKDLRRLALDFSHKTSTKFDFHKENF